MAEIKEDPKAPMQDNPANPETNSPAGAATAEPVKKDKRQKDPSDPKVMPFQLVTLATRQRLLSIGKPNDETLNLLIDAYEKRNAAPAGQSDDKTIQGLQDEIKSLKLQLQEAKNANGNGAADIQKLNQDIAELKRQLNAKEQEITAKMQEIAAKDGELAERQQHIKDLEASAVTVDPNTDQVIKQLNAELADAKKRAQKAEQDAKELQQTVNGLNTAKRELEKQLKEAKDDLEAAENRYLDFERSATEDITNRYPEGDILNFFPPITARMLELTAQRLTACRTDSKEITPQMVLGDMFNRYTIDQFNLWFYKWVISEKEMIEIAMAEEPKITSKKLLRAALGIK